MTVRLSKSKLIAFRQCPKRLWLEVHRPDLSAQNDSAQQRFAAGYRIGEMAQMQYPDGILISPDNDLAQALKQTKVHLSASPRKTLFEATFQAEGVLVRADLLVPVKGGWHMVEVKSSTKVKNYHLEDAAIQSWVVTKLGLPLAQTSMQLVDSNWVYPGGNQYSGLLKTVAVDEEINSLQAEVPTWTAAAQAVTNGPEPIVKMGKQCSEPFDCSFQGYCTSLAPPIKFPISWLPRLHSSKKSAYEAAGFVDLRHIPPEELSDKQQRVQNSTIKGKPFFEPLTNAEKKTLAGTRYYLDFETISFSVPIWAGTRPYQQVPFQWSCHIEQTDGIISHAMFLDLTGTDPSRAFAESMVKALGKSGPIIVYNQSFEKARVAELAARFADLAPALNRILARIVDLLPLAYEHYYHPNMHGSWSIKAVLPNIAPEMDYSNLQGVADGGAAQEAYLEAIHPATAPERKLQLASALHEYCKRDTAAMICVLHFLTQSKVGTIP